MGRKLKLLPLSVRGGLEAQEEAALTPSQPAMATAEKFCLRWNDFESNISSAFRELREDKDFFDITLTCDDDQIQAHKVILSACTPFLLCSTSCYIMEKLTNIAQNLCVKGLTQNN